MKGEKLDMKAKVSSIISSILAVIIIAGLISLPAAAAGIISLDKTVYEPNEKIIVTVTGITNQMEDDSAFVAIYQRGADHNDWGDEYYYPSAGSSTLTFEAPDEAGGYEIRLYRTDDLDDVSLVMKAQFTVRQPGNQNPNTSAPVSTAQQSGSVYLILDKTIYTLDEDITVTAYGITETMIDESAWMCVYEIGASSDELNYDWANLDDGVNQYVLTAPDEAGTYEVRLFKDASSMAESFVMAVTFTVMSEETEKADDTTVPTTATPPTTEPAHIVSFKSSDWAASELLTAYENNLIPERLMNEDLTLPIYRDEFAAVAVKLYEAMSGKKAEPAKLNPFTDTNDPEVLKAYALGLVNGTSATTFAPRNKLNRQEAATMLTRVYKAVKIAGWTLTDDSKFTLKYIMPAKFADDANIDGWAKDSVYFMAANGIINGLGGNKFGPKNMTSAEEASGYANASREQALVISVRSFTNLK